jgi:hypothetical protein
MFDQYYLAKAYQEQRWREAEKARQLRTIRAAQTPRKVRWIVNLNPVRKIMAVVAHQVRDTLALAPAQRKGVRLPASSPCQCCTL